MFGAGESSVSANRAASAFPRKAPSRRIRGFVKHLFSDGSRDGLLINTLRMNRHEMRESAQATLTGVPRSPTLKKSYETISPFCAARGLECS